jgi:hypothetical protein
MSSAEAQDQVCDFGSLLQMQKQGSSLLTEQTRMSTNQNRDTMKSSPFSFDIVTSPQTFAMSIMKEN